MTSTSAFGVLPPLATAALTPLSPSSAASPRTRLPRLGQEMPCDIYVGLVYYQRLRHMVSDKFQVSS